MQKYFVLLSVLTIFYKINFVATIEQRTPYSSSGDIAPVDPSFQTIHVQTHSRLKTLHLNRLFGVVVRRP